MNGLTKLWFVVCLVLMASAVFHPAFAATLAERTAARLDALEKENAALRARVNRLEASTTATTARRPSAAEPNLALASAPPRHYEKAMDANAGQVVRARRGTAQPRFEVDGTLLFLQPGGGNLEYGTLVTPLPLPTPNWDNQALKPDYKAAFRVGARLRF